MAEDWAEDEAATRDRVSRLVADLLTLANDDEARRLLGVEGTLEDELDLTFLDNPAAWIGAEIANALRLEDDEDEGVSLSSVVALVRLFRILRGGQVDARELQEAVLDALADSDDADDDDDGR